MKHQENPVISVIMSVYNGEKYLAESINSILTQTFSDFEFIIINDASSDSTADILERYKRSDSRIEVVTNSQNIGLTKSLNKAIGVARGNYIARMDADDISYPLRFEKQISFLKGKRNIGVVGCWYYVIDSCGSIIEEKRPPLNAIEIKKKLFNSTPIIHPGALLRKDAIENVNGYDASFKYAQDRDLFCRIARFWEFGIIPEILMEYRCSKNAISLDKELEQKKYRIIVMKKAISAGTYPKLFYAFILLQIVSLHLPAPIRKIKNIMFTALGLRKDVTL